MVPGAIMVLDQLPQNANGKLDRQALPAFGMPAASQAPEGELETLLARIWAEVLGLERVGRSDNFFALGGDSILGLQIVSGLRRFGWKLSPRQLRSEEHTSELQSPCNLVCRLLLEKKNRTSVAAPPTAALQSELSSSARMC